MKTEPTTRAAGLIFAAAATVLLVVMAGCVRPQAEPPHATLIETPALGLADQSSAQSSAAAPARWWEAFGDPQLDTLVRDALARNPTLEQALARLRLGQAQNLAAAAENLPSVAIDADASRQRFSENYYIPPPYAGNRYWIGQSAANLHWNLDFWGRQAALIEQSRAELTAGALDVASARLALAGALAQAYVDLYRSWRLIDIAAQMERQRDQRLALTRQRVSAGLDTGIELKIAEAALPEARTARLQAQSSRDLAVHRLAALAGEGADRYASIARPALALDAALPLPDRLPMDLLARRPDVLAARARVDAAAAGREAARAAFYPNIDLEAFVGLQAIGLDALMHTGSAVYGAGPALHLPIFDAQRLRAAYKGATAGLDAAVAGYNAVVLQAVRETADQISLNESLSRQRDEIERTLQASTAAYELAQKRYAAGLTTQLVVLDAESRVLNAQRDLIAAEAKWAVARVTLLLMLGGSFDPAAPLTIAASQG